MYLHILNYCATTYSYKISSNIRFDSFSLKKIEYHIYFTCYYYKRGLLKIKNNLFQNHHSPFESNQF